ncbi:MAG: SDR family NAD(P)-dependent oxidoreductase [Proteobacteria bacterium]|nr:SDR family NAD(P)-dependent oxidoreductase [Pseudomonadota bacterium]
MNIEGSTALVTGAAGGIGRRFAEALIARGAAKVYAVDLPASDFGFLSGLGRGIVTLRGDVTREAEAARLAGGCADVSLLINSAGIFGLAGLIAAKDLGAARREMEVNLWGSLIMCRAFAPVLGANGAKNGGAGTSGGSAIMNILSEAARVCVPFAGSYCVSKAAAWNMTQGVRAELAGQGTHVLAVFPATTDTPMVGMLDMDKLDPAEVANAALDALEQGLEDISIGEHALHMERLMQSDYKALEKESAEILPGATAVSEITD